MWNLLSFFCGPQEWSQGLWWICIPFKLVISRWRNWGNRSRHAWETPASLLGTVQREVNKLLSREFMPTWGSFILCLPSFRWKVPLRTLAPSTQYRISNVLYTCGTMKELLWVSSSLFTMPLRPVRLPPVKSLRIVFRTFLLVNFWKRDLEFQLYQIRKKKRRRRRKKPNQPIHFLDPLSTFYFLQNKSV